LARRMRYIPDKPTRCFEESGASTGSEIFAPRQSVGRKFSGRGAP
jgi:hypothetical protein